MLPTGSASVPSVKLLLRGAAAIIGAGLAAVPTVAATAVQDPAACPPNAVGLSNPSFEEPAGKGPRQLPQDAVSGWSTTAGDRLIELWGPGNAYANRGNEVAAVAGAQFAELNATRPSMLYQDVETTPGQTLSWRVNHRARDVGAGVDRDTMHVMIGAPGGETAQVPSGGDSADIVDTDAAWGSWTGVYKVPAGQTVTRFGFKAVASASGSASMGNFLDDITFGTPACVIAEKAADTDGPVRAGDEVGYTVGVRNEGGSAADTVVLGDAVPAGSEYVAESLLVNGKPVTDATDGDDGEFTGSAVTARLGRLEGGDAVQVSFRVRVTAESAATLSNTARVDHRGVLLDEPGTSTSNTVTTPVLETAPTTSPTPSGSDSTSATAGPSPSPSSSTSSTSGPASPGASTSSTSLPVTGAGLGLPLGIAAALLTGGGLLLVAARLRRG